MVRFAEKRAEVLRCVGLGVDCGEGVLREGPRRSPVEAVASSADSSGGCKRKVAPPAFDTEQAVAMFVNSKKVRWDQPDEQGGEGSASRGSMVVAVAIMADPVARRVVAKEFERQTLAVTTRPVYDSQLRSLRRLAETAGLDLLPFTS